MRIVESNDLNEVIKVAVLGYGYWGPHMARNLFQMEGFSLVAIIDLSTERLKIAAQRFPNVPGFHTLEEAVEAGSIDALIIASPTHTHFDLAIQSLNYGLHTLVEKPLTTSTEQARALTLLAKKNNCILMVDHTYLYSPAVEKLRELVDSGDLGDLIFFDSMRVNLGLFQPDVSVLWDLAVHDLAILGYVTGKWPISVSAVGGRHQSSNYDAAVFLTLKFSDLFFAHINVSWLSPMKIRRTVLSGSSKTVLFDDMSVDERIRIYDAGVDAGVDALLEYRLGDVAVPRIPNAEALAIELRHFRDCIIEGLESRSSGQESVAVIAILQAAQLSAERDGEKIMVNYFGGEE